MPLIDLQINNNLHRYLDDDKNSADTDVNTSDKSVDGANVHCNM